MVGQRIALWLAVIERLLQRIEHKVRSHRTAQSPAHDSAREHINDKCDVNPALLSRKIGEIRHLKLVGPVGLKLTIDPLQRTRQRRIRNSGFDILTPSYTLQTQAAHQALERCDTIALSGGHAVPGPLVDRSWLDPLEKRLRGTAKPRADSN